jgi:hypothetical protein
MNNIDENFIFFETSDIENQKINQGIELNNILAEINVDNNLRKIRKSKSCPDNIIKKNFFTFNEIKENEIIDETMNILHLNNEHDEMIYDEEKNKLINYENNEKCFYKIDKFESLNKFLTIFLHVTIMISFEIFFYFNFIIYIERNEILKKLNKYFDDIDVSNLNNEEQLALQNIFNSEEFKTYYNELYDDYKTSLNHQKYILNKLVIRACLIGGVFYLIFIILLIYGLYKKNKIKWSWLAFENILMFLFLGIFEYLFFMEIIMNYDPLTDAEIKYYVVNDIYIKMN